MSMPADSVSVGAATRVAHRLAGRNRERSSQSVRPCAARKPAADREGGPAGERRFRLNASLQQVTDQGRTHLVGHVDHVDAGLPCEMGACQMGRGADAGRAVVDGSRLRFGEIDELPQRAGCRATAGPPRPPRGHRGGRCRRSRAPDRTEGSCSAFPGWHGPLVDQLKQGCTAVGGCRRHRLRRDEPPHAARGGLEHDDLLAEPPRQPFPP